MFRKISSILFLTFLSHVLAGQGLYQMVLLKKVDDFEAKGGTMAIENRHLGIISDLSDQGFIVNGGPLENGIEVRYFLYPRGGPASRSWNTSEEVWCSKDRGDALTQAKLDRKFETTSCDASAVSDHYVIGQEVGLNGTPAIVLDDGELIGGYLPPDALRMRLDQKAAVHELE